MVREQLRETGGVVYHLVRRPVKNINLRVREDGTVWVSAPARVGLDQLDRFVAGRAEWIQKAKENYARRASLGAALASLSRNECQRRLQAALDRMYPLVEKAGVPYPALKLRKMTSRWGSCHYRRASITLNTALAACPEELQDYVALHELCHFLWPDHSPRFYAALTERMPDWRERRQRLTGYRLDV